MASIVEAYDSTMKEAFTGFKIFLWAIPLSMAIDPTNPLRFIVGIIISFLLIGFVVTLANNVITKAPTVVPGINFLKIIINGLFGTIAILPYAAIGVLITWAYFTYVHIPNYVWDTTFKIIISLFSASLPITALCILSRRLNLFNVFNIKKFCQGFFEIFLSYTFFSIRIGIFISLFVGFLIYIFALFIGFTNSFWTYLVSCIIMLYIILFSNAIAQMSDDVYTFLEKDEEKTILESQANAIIAKQQYHIKDMR